MNQIINKLSTLDPHNNETVKETLTTFFQNLQKHVDSDHILWLRNIESVINRFPRYCVSHRTTIENYLTQFVDSCNYTSVIEVAKCAHALQQVRSSQDKTTNAKTCWRDQIHLLCQAAHVLLGALFPNSVDTYRSKGVLQNRKENVQANTPLSTVLHNIKKFSKQTRNNNVELREVLLCTRLKNIFIFLQAMLIEIYPVAKPIQPQLILDVIVRTLSVSSGSNNNTNVTDIVGIKTQALRTLDALNACLGSNLIPYSPLVFRIAMQTLRWSSENSSDESRKVRCIAYGSLGKWLTSLHVYRPEGRARWEEKLTEHIIKDITPHTHIVQLTMNSRPSKNLSKKAKRKLANTMLHESNLAAHIPGEKNKLIQSEEINEEVALAALECAKTLLTVCGVFLKPETHKAFQERLVRECYNSEAYTDDRLLSLLRVLEASRSCVPPGVPPPTQYCLQLYSALVNRCSPEISKFCSEALLNIRLHLHCSPPSLNYILEVPKDRQKKTENKMRMSKRNRVALEALLGPDKIPRPDGNAEINELGQSPNKRPCLNEAEDKISISSDSESSVEICEDDNNYVEESARENHIGTDEFDDQSDQDDPIALDDQIGHNAMEGNQNSSHNETDVCAVDGNDVGKIDGNNHAVIEEVNEINKKYTENTKAQAILNTATFEEKNHLYEKTVTIHEAITQLPFNVSNDITDGAGSPVSMEVVYDYPNTAADKITVLDKIEDENLPSTNDTDDVQITCGQVIKYSQEIESEKSKCEESQNKESEAVAKVNGLDTLGTDVVSDTESNQIVTACHENGQVTKCVTGNKEVSVEDMLADFVDEVNEDVSQA